MSVSASNKQYSVIEKQEKNHHNMSPQPVLEK